MILKGESAFFNHIFCLNNSCRLVSVFTWPLDVILFPTDQEQLDKEITDLRKRLKAKVNRLNELQGRTVLPA